MAWQATRASTIAGTARACAVLAHAGSASMQQTRAVAQARVHCAGRAPEALMDSTAVILGIVAVGDRRCIILPAGRVVVGRNDARPQDVRTDEPIRCTG
jgi:hypothetical protein